MSFQRTILNWILYYLIRPRTVNGLDITKLRADAMPEPKTPRTYGCAFETETLAGVKVTFVRPAEIESTETIVHFHGGLYLIGIVGSHWEFLARICRETKRMGVMVDYRLAPEHPFPAALDDAVAVLDALAKQHGAKNLVVTGDSAGGGLAVASAMRLRDKGREAPGKLVLLSPWLDITMKNPDIPALVAKDRVLAPEGAGIAGSLYAGDEDPRQPYLSPVYGELSGLPPMFLQIGTHELLLPDCRAFKARAAAAQAPLEYREYAGLFHVWTLFFAILPEGEEALQDIVGFITQRG